MRDGRVDVLGGGGGIKITVTIDTHRHGYSLGGVQGALVKGQPCWGVVRRQRGNAPRHPVGRNSSF